MSGDDNDEKALKRLTVRELRQRAIAALGSKVAAGLKLKDELVAALAKRFTKGARPAKAAAKAKAAPKKSPPRKELRAEPKSAKAQKKTSQPSSAPRFVMVQAPVAPAPLPRPSKPPKAQVVAEAYELPISRDFFVDPRRPSLPSAYGDDRLLCFRREPLAVVVSWDLASTTFGDGQGVSLEVISAKGRLLASQRVEGPTGLATFEHLPQGRPLSVQVVKQGRVMTRGRPFMLGAPASDDDGAWQMTAPLGEALPPLPERQAWSAEEQAQAAAHARVQRGPRRASSSRLSS